ncbi:MAG: D-aminoacylase [Acidimicrobiia bacterium]|nr:D-aminoacylase [Acidimicrobiia bacterium]
MLDILIKGGTVVDGTGSPATRADVGLRDGRVAVVEDGIDEVATRTIDAGGCLVTPGFVDPHTHYDAQLFWDPLATPSNVHGVTTVIGGNCGFTLAPLRAEDADYTRRMMAQVEGMPLGALEQGVEWSWETFGEYLDRLDGNIGVNAGFLVGHCALRRYVMGAGAIGRAATSDEVAAMVRELHTAIESGGLGFSTTLSKTHSDGNGDPVGSRWAAPDEVVALCAAAGEHVGTSLEAIVDGCLDQFADDEIDLLVRMSAAAKRPLNWNVLTVDSRVPERVTRQLEASTRAAEADARIVALTMPVIVPMNMSFLNYCALFMFPGWDEVMKLEPVERAARLRDPETRAWMDKRANSREAGVFRRLADWRNYVIGDTYSAQNEGLKGRTVRDIASERGTAPFDALLDLVIADDLRTILWPIAPDGDDASWALRKTVWEDPRAMIGGSDAGAHLDRMCGAPYTTRFLGDMLRGRKLVPIEAAVKMITQDPARLFGLRNRGEVLPGNFADIVILDPDSVGSDAATLVADLPGGATRLTADAQGIAHVFVNGVETVTDSRATGVTPGTVIRSGRDTETASL